MDIETLFFELLQVAIGRRQSLSVVPTKEEWRELFEMSKKQALTAIAFRGVKNLSISTSSAQAKSLFHSTGSGQVPGEGADFGSDGGIGIDEMTYLKWLGMTAKVAQRNKQLNDECAKVCQEFAHDGVRPVVLKGQSNLVYYPEDLRECRTAGDIDLWCDVPEGVEVAHEANGVVEKREFKGIEGVIEYCKQYERCQGREIPWDRVLYYHCELTSPSVIGIEPHYRPSYLNSPLRNWRLQRWFYENEPWRICDAKIDGHTLPILPTSTNVVYQLLHIYKHLFEEGIGLRQLLDYYFVLRALHIEQGSLADRTVSMAQWTEGMGIVVKSNAEIMRTLGRFGMKKFARAVMYVLQTVLDPPKSSLLREDFEDWQKRWPWMICEPNEKEGKFLLNEIMQAGNFGKYDDRIKHGTPSIPLFRGKKVPQQLWHAIEKTKHNLRLFSHYPAEVLCEPFFRVYHWIWRRFELWR